ncbi:MAG TPA: type II CAAX endopeptidase family protein [Terriglobales bacterium]|nr:type II CAAX endopeptidase family protein [Terriglobales bacterium]
MFTDRTGKLRPIWAFWFALFLGALAFFVSGNIAHEAAGNHPFRAEFVFRALWALLLVGIFVWLLTVGDHIEEHRIAAQGLPRVKGWLKQFLLGSILGFLFTVLAVAPIHFWGHFRTRNLMTWHLVPNLGAVILTLLCGTLAEEVMFRGYPFQRLEQAIGTPRAVVLFSVFYGILHGLHRLNPEANGWGIANTVLIGILLTVAYLRTRALWLPWGIHFGWNATLGLVLGLPVSGFRVFNLWIYTQAYGPNWLTGGSYGIEASAPGAIVILLGLLVVWKLPLAKLAHPAPHSSSESALPTLMGLKP